METTAHATTDDIFSVCGLNPNRGNYQIFSFSTFFTQPTENQCARCCKILKKRGYNLEKLRAQYGAIYAQAQKFPITAYQDQP